MCTVLLLEEVCCLWVKGNEPRQPVAPVAVLYHAHNCLKREGKCGLSVDRCRTNTGLLRRCMSGPIVLFMLAAERFFIFQDMDGGAPSLFGPSFDGGGRDLLRSFDRRNDAGLITYMTAIKIRAMMIRKKFVPPVALGRLGRSVHSLSLQ